MHDYEVTMMVKVKVYATDERDAVKQAGRSTTNWDDWRLAQSNCRRLGKYRSNVDGSD
jgi:hypothetical protein